MINISKVKKPFIIFIIVVLPILGWNQTISEQKINEKVKEGLNYILEERQNNPEDLLIVLAKNNKNFYMVFESDSMALKTKEVTPPNLASVSENPTMISKDSVIDLIWIKGKTFQTLSLKNSQIPFKKLKKRFPCEKIELLQTDIYDLYEQKYFEEIRLKHGPLKVIIEGDINNVISIITEGSGIKPFPLKVEYPAAAISSYTGGSTRIGYVLTKDGDVVDFHVFQYLSYGCTESLISTVKEMSSKLREKGYKSNETCYIDMTFHFIMVAPLLN